MYHLAEYTGSTEIEGVLWKVDNDGDVVFEGNSRVVFLTKKDLQEMIKAVNFHLDEE